MLVRHAHVLNGRDLNILVERSLALRAGFTPTCNLRKSTLYYFAHLHDVSLSLLRAGRVSAFQEIVFDDYISGGRSHQK
jgi:hypothetical protein